VNVFNDSGGSDSKPCKIVVRSIPHTTLPFSLLFPDGQVLSTTGDTIRFSWQSAIDLEGRQPMYQMNLADDQSFHHMIDQCNNILVTTFTIFPKHSYQMGGTIGK